MKAKATPLAPLFRLRTLTRSALLLILLGLLAIPFFSSAASYKEKHSAKADSATAQELTSDKGSMSQTNTDGSSLLAFAGTWSRAFLMPQGGGEVITIYEADCTTVNASFDLGATVCVKLTGAPIGGRIRRRLIISNPAGLVLAKVDVTTDPQSLTLALPATATSTHETNVVDNRGTWRVNSLSTEDGSVKASSFFVVHDPAVSVASLGVSKNASSDIVASGSQVGFTVLVANGGPDAATTVQLTETTPSNTTFFSASQDSGPPFTCVDPGAGNTGDTVCTIATLASGAEAKFTFVYLVNSGLAEGTLLSNSATIASATVDSHTLDNTADAVVRVSAQADVSACTLDCPANKTVTANATQGGNPGAFVTYGAATVNGDCGAISNDIPSGSFFPIGDTTVTSSSEKGQSCTFTITVVESAAPTITCPPNQTAAADNTGYATVSVGSPTFTPNDASVVGVRSDSTPAQYDENGNLVSPGVNKPLTDPYPIGITGITWTVTDADGRTASCQQRITVNGECASDTGTPVITAPADVSVMTGADNSICSVFINEALGQATATDDCSVTITVSGIPSGNHFPLGTTTLTYTATDPSGQSASDTQVVTVVDNTPPRIQAPANASYTCPSEVPAADPSQATRGEVLDENGNPLPPGPPFDNCGTPNVTVSETSSGAGSTADPRIITRTFTATDGSGNTASSTQTITVTDGTAPSITAPANVTAHTGPGALSCDTVVSNATMGTASASDNCEGVTVSRDPSGNTFPVGTTTITWTATDWAGNTATATQDVTVIDNTVPVVTAPANVTAYTGPGAQSCSTDVSDATLGSASATDNCPGVGSITRTGVPAGNSFPVGNTTVTYSVTDANGNSSSATQIVTVIDNTVPVVTAPANVTAYTGPGAQSCGTVVSDATLGSASATDNCPGVGSITRTGVPAGNAFPVGNTTVTYSVTDAHGNSSSATQTVTVIDNTAPVISCPTNIVIEPTCPTGAIATYATPTATDNCGVQSVVRTAGPASGSVFPIGTTTVTHVATDIYGNTSSCSFTVTVLTPQAVVQNLIDQVNASSLTGTQKNGLLARLNAALTAINGGGGNACAKLSDFVNSVGNLISHGDISAAQGNAWISSANNVRNTIGCTNLPCS